MLHIVGWQRNNNNVNTENQNTIRIQTVQWLIIFSVTMVERRQSDQKNRQKVRIYSLSQRVSSPFGRRSADERDCTTPFGKI